MCTTLFAVRPDAPAPEPPFMLLGTRDEFADRPWDPPAAWWPEHSELIGGRDREAGGTWLAVHPTGNRMSVVLNRWEQGERPAGGWASRGVLPLLAAEATGLPQGLVRRMRPFNLVTASARGASWLAWDGKDVAERAIEPGVHVLGAGGIDEPGEPRVETWLPRLREAARPEPTTERPPEEAWGPWLELLGDSMRSFPADSGKALIRGRDIGGRRHATLALCAVALGSAAERATSAQPALSAQRRPRFDFAGLPAPAHLPDRLRWIRAV